MIIFKALKPVSHRAMTSFPFTLARRGGATVFVDQTTLAGGKALQALLQEDRFVFIDGGNAKMSSALSDLIKLAGNHNHPTREVQIKVEVQDAQHHIGAAAAGEALLMAIEKARPRETTRASKAWEQFRMSKHKDVENKSRRQ